MRREIYIFILSVASVFTSYAQNGHQLVLPDSAGWNLLAEGDIISFRVSGVPQNDSIRFSIVDTPVLGFRFDSLGNFSWTPSFDLVNRVDLKKDFTVIFQGRWPSGERIRKSVTFTISHVNRAPQIEELPVFYVKQGDRNTYQIPSEYVSDPDGDPIVFKPVVSQMPEGMTLNSQGLLSWNPSRNQFNALRSSPLVLEFIVQDQPFKAETTGKLRIAQTQLDLPPELLIVPGDTLFQIKEDETINLKIYLSDPNGDDNVRSAGFVASDTRIPQTSFKSNTALQHEFIWQPGYDFVDGMKNLPVEVVFFALDRSNNRAQRKITISVLDAENLVEKDALQFQKYRNTLAAAAELLRVLDENQKKLNEDYKRAKKGKRKRSVVNASLGAMTGFSPALLEPDQSKVVSAVGGTTVLTLNTLEATEVIGKSKDDIMDKIKINVDIRNKVQSGGDEFARKYTAKITRRNSDFEKDIDRLRTVLNDQRIVLLELDAFRKNATPPTNKAIKKAFTDFTEE